jgi:hypothetical protein
MPHAYDHNVPLVVAAVADYVRPRAEMKKYLPARAIFHRLAERRVLFELARNVRNSVRGLACGLGALVSEKLIPTRVTQATKSRELVSKRSVIRAFTAVPCVSIRSRSGSCLRKLGDEWSRVAVGGPFRDCSSPGVFTRRSPQSRFELRRRRCPE